MGRPVDFSFYLITDRHQARERSLLDVCGAALRAGVRAIQLREKDVPTRPLLSLARELSRLATAQGARIFINDRIDVAMALGTGAVHLPARGAAPSVARRLLGGSAIIGVSAHSADDVLRAEGAGADFVVLGPIFDTPSKRAFGPPIGLAELERARRRCRLPLFGIGGITLDRVHDVRRAGAHGIAVVGSVMAADDVERACREFLTALEKWPPTEVDGGPVDPQGTRC
jgi:thiamine-phosphate pyrophosphorylase